jgi:hypothetical protein
VEEWVDDAAASLEKLVGSPMAGAVHGTVRIVSITEPLKRGRYQDAHLEVEIAGPGIEPAIVPTDVVLDRKYWPAVGTVLPARIAPSGAMDIDWDVLSG